MTTIDTTSERREQRPLDLSTPLAVCGLGNMGLGLALRLRDLGVPLAVFNRTPSKAQSLVDAGAKLAPTPAAAVAGRRLVLLSLSDEHAVRDVLLDPEQGALGALDAGAIVVDCSTTSSRAAEDVAALAAERGVDVIDACVIGNPFHARTGDVRLVLGGRADVIARARPLLEHLAKEVVAIGANGAASSMKVALNLVMGAQMAAVAEAVALAEAAGIDGATALGIIGSSGYASPMLAFRCALAASRAFRPAAFRLDLMAKDLHLALGEAARTGAALPSTATVAALHDDAIAAGLGDCDAVALVALLERRAGLPVEDWPGIETEARP